MTRIDSGFRARNSVERMVLGLMIFCSMIAIATTAGIVLSLIFETISFFRQYSVTEFFFGTTWSPRFEGNSRLGMLPLLWGTLYISFIALLVAVPIACWRRSTCRNMPAPRLRSIAKPAVECWPASRPSSMACSRW